jgi:electron transport complex protein RnfD
MIGSPFSHSPDASVSRIMLTLLAALLPAVALHAVLFGPGIFISLILCSVFGLALEVLMLNLRGFPAQPFLRDGSVLVTAWLIAMALPTLLPWWVYLVGMGVAVIAGKHLYGGLGQNLFNPAMLGFTVLLVSFPTLLSTWPAASLLAAHTPSLTESLQLVFQGASSISLDAYTMATPLDNLKVNLRAGLTIQQGWWPTIGAREWVALGYLAGGLMLIALRIITWHIPVAFLAGITLTALILKLIDPAHQAGPFFHLIAGGSMLGAFFFATDPVTAATTPIGKLIFGALAGVIAVFIRAFGSYPDGIGFAILLMNAAAPLIDAYTQPKVLGHTRRRRPGASE